MSGRRVRFLAVGVAAIVALGAAGCGGDGDSSDTAALEEVLHGLKKAAMADEGYDAAQHAKDLSQPQRKVVGAFCDSVQGILEELEIPLHLKAPYFDSRIATTAQSELDYLAQDPIYDAVDRMKEILEFPLSVKQAKQYEKACYEPGKA